MHKMKLEDLCETIVDCPHSTPKWETSGIPVIRNFNLDNTVISLDNPSYVSEETYLERTRRAVPQKNDIIFSREAPMGVLGIMPDNLKCCLGQRLVLIRPDASKISPRYLMYALASDFVQTQIRRADIAGSIVSNLTLPQIRSLIIPIVEDSAEAADLLGAIDDKIQTNQRICKELEETISLIYDYWFTQFDFPDENGNPYRLSGGNISSVHKVEKPLPWSLGQLSDFVQIGTNNILPSAMPAIVEHYSIPAFDSMQYPSFDPSSDIQSSKYQIPSNSFLISKLNPQFKRVWNPLYLTNSPVCSTEFVVLKCKRSIATSYIFSVLNSDRFQSFMQSNAVASTGSRSRVQPDRILEYTLPVPPEKILCAFNKAARPVLESEKSIRIENHSLMNIRKWLMPMLMNGQVKASELI